VPRIGKWTVSVRTSVFRDFADKSSSAAAAINALLCVVRRWRPVRFFFGKRQYTCRATTQTSRGSSSVLHSLIGRHGSWLFSSLICSCRSMSINSLILPRTIRWSKTADYSCVVSVLYTLALRRKAPSAAVSLLAASF
jgi:hypothetical protein